MRALPGKDSRQPPGAEPVSRDRAAADQRRRILEAIAEQGYQETTMEEIVRRARVGYATFYKHHPDKEAAFLALLDAAIEQTVERVEGVEGWPRQAIAANLREGEELEDLLPECAELILLPYLGPDEAARLAGTVSARS